MSPREKAEKKGTIYGVPSRAGVMAPRENIKLGAWPSLSVDSTRGLKYTGRASGLPVLRDPLTGIRPKDRCEPSGQGGSGGRTFSHISVSQLVSDWCVALFTDCKLW